MEETALLLAGIVVLSWLCQWSAWLLRVPAILFLLLTGIIIGPTLGLLDPKEIFGDLLYPIVSLSVAIILFEGGLSLKHYELEGIEKVVQRLVSVGVLVTCTITAVASHCFVGFSWEIAFLFGAITSVTGPTVIIPMLRAIRPTAKIANILKWEGIIIDPVGAIFSVLVFELIVVSDGSLTHTAISFIVTVLVGLVFGLGGGYLFGLALKKHLLPEYLINLSALAFVLAIFTFSNFLKEESGLLAVTVAGIWLANARIEHVDDILDFKESISILLVSSLFIIMAAGLSFADFKKLGMPALFVFLVLQFLARPLKVHTASLGSDLTWNERHLLAWIAPRGIVAAAVAALFSLRIDPSVHQGADMLVPLTFMIIIGTVSLQSLTAGPIARMLGVAEPSAKGFLISGAGPVAQAIAHALLENEFTVLLVDSNYDNIAKARMAGLPVYFGSPVSEKADRRLDLVGIGKLLAITPQSDLNTLSVMRYRQEFGRKNVYAIRTGKKNERGDSGDLKAKHLFSTDMTYAKLASMLSKGGAIKSTTLTENYDFPSYRLEHGEKSAPLFAVTPKGEWRAFKGDEAPDPQAGWTIISLIPAEEPGRS